MTSAAGTPPELLRVENLTKIYPQTKARALTGVNLRIARRECVAVVGPSGSGKSTLLNLIGALDRPTSGTICFQGRPLSELDLNQYRSRRVGFVFQSFLLVSSLTALENVQLPILWRRMPNARRAEKARQLLEKVGLGQQGRQLSSTLSCGERQRAAIARALVNDPMLLLADEPTGNLDTRAALEVLDLFDEMRSDRDLTTIIVTHSETVARRSDRMVRILDGRIEEDSGALT
jgi:putative ABC transport system ATP-binding protein